MTVRVSKPEFNLREKLSELDKPIGLKGSELLKSETAQDARNLVGAGRRNIIINGDFRIAQRGTTHNSSGHRTVDRFKMNASGANATLTQSQHALSSSDAPYSHGFRYSYHLNNAGQNANSQGYVIFQYNIEAQDMAQSGWNYTSDKDHITISFWVKSSITHTFLFTLYTADGTPQDYNVLFPVQADKWKKIIMTVPGDPDITFDNNNDYGLQLMFNPYMGSHYTSGSTVKRWRDHAGYTSRPDMDDKWWKTASTFEITGVQLEVGSNATEFEHRSRSEELALCQRYFFIVKGDNNHRSGIPGYANSTTELRACVQFPVPMRVSPTVSGTATAMVFDAHDDSASFNCSTLSAGGSLTNTSPHMMVIETTTSGMTNGQAGTLEFRAANGSISFDAEL
tara:strand:- start:182 stop:1369 length:1188 start_codon:yes stop_codon:yes gene_type:complete